MERKLLSQTIISEKTAQSIRQITRRNAQARIDGNPELERFLLRRAAVLFDKRHSPVKTHTATY